MAELSPVQLFHRTRGEQQPGRDRRRMASRATHGSLEPFLARHRGRRRSGSPTTYTGRCLSPLKPEEPDITAIRRARFVPGRRVEPRPQAVHLDQDRRTDPRLHQTTSTTNQRRRTLGPAPSRVVPPHPEREQSNTQTEESDDPPHALAFDDERDQTGCTRDCERIPDRRVVVTGKHPDKRRRRDDECGQPKPRDSSKRPYEARRVPLAGPGIPRRTILETRRIHRAKNHMLAAPHHVADTSFLATASGRMMGG